MILLNKKLVQIEQKYRLRYAPYKTILKQMVSENVDEGEFLELVTQDLQKFWKTNKKITIFDLYLKHSNKWDLWTNMDFSY